MNKIMSKIDELLKQVGADFDIENKKAKVTVSSNGTDIINIKIEVLEDNSAKIESEKFEEYINTLPDELFEAVIDFIGEDELKRINDCLASDNLESVRSGIVKFKYYLKKTICNKINDLNNILQLCK